MPEPKQIITKLTPLADVFTMLEELVKLVAPRAVAIADAEGGVLAADMRVTAQPARPTASNDGWAVAAADVADASGYAPVALPRVPSRVEIGDELPAESDAVLPPDAVMLRGTMADAVATAAPVDGVLAPGGDIDGTKALYVAGHRLRRLDIAVLTAAEVASVNIRTPRVTIAIAREDLRLVPAAQFIARDCAGQGARPQFLNGIDVEGALATGDADAVVIVGGSGVGVRDDSVSALARVGRVAAHGIGIKPGETTAFGECGGRPVLIVPGRLDAAIAAWLFVGRSLLSRLSGLNGTAIASRYRLTRKVTSTIGLCELVPVCRSGGEAEPLGGSFLSLSALARANGYIEVAAASEGHAAGSEVAVYGWP